MAKIILTNNVTLDGVMQAPGRPDEDTRGGFAHGGWAGPYNDESKLRKMGEGMQRTSAMLFGRRTYEDFAAIWPNAPQPNPFTDRLNNTQKFVVSNTLAEPLPWMNSTLLRGDAARSVAKLKREHHGDIAMLGSGVLAHSLMASGLIDEFVLVIHPLVLGQGRRLFAADAFAKLKLVDSVTTDSGLIIATYLLDSREGQ